MSVIRRSRAKASLVSPFAGNQNRVLQERSSSCRMLVAAGDSSLAPGVGYLEEFSDRLSV